MQERHLRNIPTDLLRTLVAVVDLRSFTKAAAHLGVTQPAVSAQIKRLQFLLGGDLFDRSVQGISLTSHGELVVGHARRLLAINDQILRLGRGGSRPELVIRIGTPSDYVASILPDTLARLRQGRPELRFVVRTNFYDPLLRELRAGDLDLLVALSMSEPHDARHYWPHQVVWVRGSATRIDPQRPVPLVSHGESSVYHRLVLSALKTAGLEWEDIFTSPSTVSLANAVAAGLGVMAITRQRAKEFGMIIWEDGPLPKLPALYSCIYVREGGAREAYNQLADEIATVLRDQTAESPLLTAAGGNTNSAA
jgi:DNA-binding transcriptional LysR family regulator